MGDLFGGGAKRAADRSAKQSEALIAKQRQTEIAGLAEEEDTIARQRLLATGKTAGRRSLIRTSETGTTPRATLG